MFKKFKKFIDTTEYQSKVYKRRSSNYRKEISFDISLSEAKNYKKEKKKSEKEKDTD